MGFDRGVLPKDRDRDETYPWMGLVAIAVIVGGFLLLMLLASRLASDEPARVPLETETRVVITAVL
jgi:hypothetical protein